jgi:hypothetical protein
MSSTLDDMESYEFFQQELDEYLKQFEKIESNKNKLVIINVFIEYIGFIKNKTSFEEISEEEITEEFIEYFKLNFKNELIENNILSTIHDFFIFINHLQPLPSILLKVKKN